MTIRRRYSYGATPPRVVHVSTAAGDTAGLPDTGVTIAKPSGAATGDEYLAVVWGSTAGLFTMAGWTTVFSGATFGVFSKAVDVIGDGPAFTFTSSVSRAMAGKILLIRNRTSAWAVSSSETSALATGSLVIPGITVPGYGFLFVFAHTQEVNTLNVAPSSPASMTQLDLNQSVLPSHVVYKKAYTALTATGDISSFVWTFGGSFSANQYGIAIGIGGA